MIQRIIHYVRGYVKVQVHGYSAERFLNLCSHHQIYIWRLEPKENTYEFYITLQGFRKLRPIVRKTHTKIVLVRRCGLPFFIYQNRKREAFLAGILLCIGLLFFYSSYIWDIHFEGNEKWTNETLLEFLETKDVMPAMPKSKVDCPQIVKEIRKEYDDIVWVSASVDGSRLRIQIKENEDTFQKDDTKDTWPTDLIASEDGVITSMITRSGVPQVHIGDTVKKGDVLVSGRVEVFNDAKEVVDYQYQQSDADIYADTIMQYKDTIPTNYYEKQYEEKKQRRAWYVKLNSRMFSIGSTKYNGKNIEKYTKERRLKLGENFYLPISYGEILMKPYTTKEKKYKEKELQRILTQKFIGFSEDLTEKGIQICENNVKIHVDENSATAEGILFLNKKITEAVDTEILEIERNEQNESIGTDD